MTAVRSNDTSFRCSLGRHATATIINHLELSTITVYLSLSQQKVFNYDDYVHVGVCFCWTPLNMTHFSSPFQHMHSPKLQTFCFNSQSSISIQQHQVLSKTADVCLLHRCTHRKTVLCCFQTNRKVANWDKQRKT